MADDFGPRLTATIIGATSEDEAFPASSLERHTARTRGWHSSKMTEFPVEITFAFDGLVELSCLRVLAHESKIPSKVDLFVYTPPDSVVERQEYPPADSADFRRLGFINFSTNEASNFCARELKTVRIKARLLYLRLVVRGCHTNSVNMFNQSGLVAADFHGSLLAPFRRGARQALLAGATPYDGFDAEVALHDLTPVKAPSSATGATRARVEKEARPGEVPAASGASRPSSARSNSGNPNFDAITAQRIKQLTLFKAKAVAEEDYDLAKALKAQIDQLQSVGEKICALEERKRVAVEQEDYDVAKLLKRQIDELRNPRPPHPRPRPSTGDPGTVAPCTQAGARRALDLLRRRTRGRTARRQPGLPLPRPASRATTHCVRKRRRTCFSAWCRPTCRIPDGRLTDCSTSWPRLREPWKR
jgi:centrosomal protein CEP104